MCEPIGPRVLNMRDLHGRIPQSARYVGRGRGSRLGNPFVIGRDGTREDVIEKYDRWLDEHPELRALVASLRGYDLVCWCAPKACHAEVLIARANA